MRTTSLMHNRAATVAIVAGMLAGWTGAADGPATATRTVPATAPAHGIDRKLHTVVSGDLVIMFEGEATFEPADAGEVRYRPRAYAGELTILKCPARPGAAVRKGEVLLELDPTPIRRDIEVAELELAGARINLDKARDDQKLGARSAELALESAKTDLEAARVALKWLTEIESPAQLRQVQLTLQDWKDRIEDQSDELDQLKKMYKTEDLTAATADIVIKRAVRALDRTREMQKLFEPQVTKTRDVTLPQGLERAKMAVHKAELSLEQARSTNAQAARTRDLAVQLAAQAVDKAQRKVDEFKGDMDAMSMRAPCDGVVYLGHLASGQWQNHQPRFVREGEKIAAQNILMTIVPPRAIRAVLAVPEAKLVAIQPGQPATVKPRLTGKAEYAGRVAGISQVPGTRGGVTGFDVTIELSNLDVPVLPGMTGAAKIVTDKLNGVLLVPHACVRGDKVTVRGSDGKDTERSITVGKTDGKMTQVVRGLEAGENVVE